MTESPSELRADTSRVVANLFLPGGASMGSRAGEIVDRVMAIPEDRIDALAAEVVENFAARHADVQALFEENAGAVSSRIDEEVEVSSARRIVLGATFTSEYAVEAAALCNPSAVEHPDQSGLEPGQLRVAIGLRSIGEGHLSSISFAEAVIGADDTWTFGERRVPLVKPSVGEGDWARTHFRRALEHEGHLGALASALLRELPTRFTATGVESALASLPEQLTGRLDSRADIQRLRELVASAYRAEFDPDTALSQRVLLPVHSEENHGMEDARFVRFTDSDGSTGFRATYTAYDGRDIAPRLITSPDLTSFAVHRLTGSAAHNKGMALFPRPVGGEHLALSRTDGENISLAASKDGVNWTDRGVVHRPVEPWELVQTGNCGSPIETPEGWIVLIHGVGPMRTYSIGALLLDLDDPSRVIARTTEPLLRPTGERQDGYVPNVVYSCGGIVHNGVLWIPFGVGDYRIRVSSIPVAALLGALSAV